MTPSHSLNPGKNNRISLSADSSLSLPCTAFSVPAALRDAQNADKQATWPTPRVREGGERCRDLPYPPPMSHPLPPPHEPPPTPPPNSKSADVPSVPYRARMECASVARAVAEFVGPMSTRHACTAA
jgi:hypothetical protein